MKALIQTFLVVGGVLGLLFGAVPAWVTWSYVRAYGASATAGEKLTALSPLFCIAAIVLGLIWKRKSDARSADDSSPNDHDAT